MRCQHGPFRVNGRGVLLPELYTERENDREFVAKRKFPSAFFPIEGWESSIGQQLPNRGYVPLVSFSFLFLFFLFPRQPGSRGRRNARRPHLFFLFLSHRKAGDDGITAVLLQQHLQAAWVTCAAVRPRPQVMAGRLLLATPKQRSPQAHLDGGASYPRGHDSPVDSGAQE